MRTAVLSIVFTTISLCSFSQMGKVSNAEIFLREGALDKAKENIEIAITGEKTMNLFRTWFIRGQIYHKIYETDNEEYKLLSEGPLDIALKSYLKAKQLDIKGKDSQELTRFLDRASKQYLKQGADAFNSKNFEGALKSFESGIKANNAIQRFDTLSTYYSAVVANALGDTSKSKTYYHQLIVAKYKNPDVYTALAGIYLTGQDFPMTDSILKIGRSMYPNDQNLLVAELNYFLAIGKDDEAKVNIEKALVNEPNNTDLNFAMGRIYDSKANHAKERPDNYTELVTKSAAYYQKALDAMPGHFNSLYNMGALLFNEGADMLNEAKKDEKMSNEAYTALKTEAHDKLREAIPFFDNAVKIKPGDVGTLNSLKEIYAQLGETEKYNEIKARLGD